MTPWLEKFAYSVVGVICVTVLGKFWDAISGKIWDAIGETVLGVVGDHLVAPIQRQFKYMCCFDSNIKELESQSEMLQRTRQGVHLGVENDRANVRIIDPNVEAWLISVSEVTSEVEGITQEKPKVNGGWLNGWCPNLILRYSLSRKAVKNTEVVAKLQGVGVSYTQTSYSPPPTSKATIPNGDFTGFESRRLTMEKIFKALKIDEIYLIGVCGMGGTGKTTMVKEVAKRAKEDSRFDEVAMAVVGQEPNQANVQACIADMLGLKELRNIECPIVRADLLRRRLLQDNKKILVILDDIWEEMDLEDMGFPLRGANKNFKMLYTSRTRYLWHNLQIKMEIPLELLSEDEAWQLFKEKVGDLADAQDLHPIAKKIANECGRLPLALVLLGGALSKKSGRNTIKEMWEGMLDRLTCASNTPADNQLYSHLELSYEYLANEEAKRLFLLCCLFKEDENIRIEDLARYGFGLSFFDGINEMGKVRRQVLLIVDDLKSRYLLLDGDNENEECVKVHDVVRDMGISIAFKDKCAIVSHGAVSEWAKTVAHEHYIAISVISENIRELPEGLTYPHLEFLMLRCDKLEKLRPNFFEGMEKLKVLDLNNFAGILPFQPLKNLTTLALEGFWGMLDNVRVIGDLPTLEVLSFHNSNIKELAEEIGKLVKLRLLDLSETTLLKRIPPGVISRLVRLEELYVIPSRFVDWEGEGQEKERNANLKEFESLSYLNTLEIIIKNHVVVPKLPIFGKLKKYKVIQEELQDIFLSRVELGYPTYERQLMINEWNCDTPAGRGGIDALLRSSDCLILQREIYALVRSIDFLFMQQGSGDLVELLLGDGADNLQQLKCLQISYCDIPDCLADIMNPDRQLPPATAVFPILEELSIDGLRNLTEICHGPVPAGSFGQLTEIYINGCEILGNLFQQPIVGCLTQLKRLDIWSCERMEEVISKEQREDVHVAPNRIEFPKLEMLSLKDLPSLVGFCRGIDQIDLPQLKDLKLQALSKVNCLFHDNNNLSSNSEQNDNIVSFLSLFPQKVAFPRLENFYVEGLQNVSYLWCSELPTNSFSKLKKLEVKGCTSLRILFHPTMAGGLVNLKKLLIKDCSTLEVVVGKEEKVGGGQERKISKTLFPRLGELRLFALPNLRRFCNSTCPLDLPRLSKMDIVFCPNMDEFSLEPVSAPYLSLPGIPWNGNLNNAIQPLQKEQSKEEEQRKEKEMEEYWRKEEEQRKEEEEERRKREERRKEEEEDWEEYLRKREERRKEMDKEWEEDLRKSEERRKEWEELLRKDADMNEDKEVSSTSSYMKPSIVFQEQSKEEEQRKEKEMERKEKEMEEYWRKEMDKEWEEYWRKMEERRKEMDKEWEEYWRKREERRKEMHKEWEEYLRKGWEELLRKDADMNEDKEREDEDEDED